MNNPPSFKRLRKQVTIRYLLNRLLGYFLRGLLVILPIAATGWLLYSLISIADTAIQENILETHIPGLGVLIIILTITLVGMFATGFITRPLFELFDTLMERAPGVKHIYSSVKDMTEAFVGDKRKFTEPVRVKHSEGVYRVGFLTQRDMAHISMPGFSTVYLPYSYAVSGEVWLVRNELIEPLDAEAPGLMKFILSGGVSGLDSES
jgi:uncharacterized membrane protein